MVTEIFLLLRTFKTYSLSIFQIYSTVLLMMLVLKLKLQYFGPLMRKADSLEKTLLLGKIEGGRRRGRQDEMVGWHHRLNGREFEQALGHGEGQGSLPCCSPWGRKESDMTERLSNTTSKILPIEICLMFCSFSSLLSSHLCFCFLEWILWVSFTLLLPSDVRKESFCKWQTFWIVQRQIY